MFVRSLALLAALAGLALSASPALAGYTHVFAGEFGSAPEGWPPPPGTFSGNMGVAVDSSDGDLFVADQGNARVQRFTSSGAPVSMWENLWSGVFGVAVDAARERVYVTEQWSDAVEVFDLSGVSLGQLETGSGWGSVNSVAVDEGNGDVYVTDQSNDAVQVFDATGAHLGSFGTAGSGPGEFNGPTGVAVDPSSHDAYVVDGGNGRVEEFSALGASYLGSLAGVSGPLALAVDGSNGDVYVGESAESLQVARYDSAGDRLYAFGWSYPWSAPRLKSIAGLAVNSSTHTVYVSDSADSAVKIFAAAPVPAATTGGVKEVSATSATFEGTVNPEGGMLIYEYFEYGLDTTYGGQAYGNQYSLTGNADYPVTGSVPPWMPPLQPNATYHYRLVAVGPNGNGYGKDRTFTTLPAAPVVDWSFAAASPESAVLHALVNPNNTATSYRFEYGQSAAYGSTTPDGVTGAVFGDQDSSIEIAGLAPDTLYHFRVIADNGTGGVQYGPDSTFKTPPATIPAAESVTGGSATLTGTFDPQGAATYRFEYGTSTGYGSSTSEVQAPSVSGDTSVSLPVEGLEPGVTYHCRLVATYPDHSTAIGADGTFATLAVATVTTGQPTGITSTGAMLHGTVDTHGQPATYTFLVMGVGNPVERLTAEQAVRSEGATEVSASVTGLPDGAEYQAVLIVTVGGVQSSGEPVAFATPPLYAVAPRVLPAEGNPYAGLPSGSVQPAGTPAKFAILFASTKGTVARIGVSVPGAGRLSITSGYVRPGRESTGGAGTYTLKVRLDRPGIRRLRKARRLKAGLTVKFTPTGGAPVVLHVQALFRRGHGS